MISHSFVAELLRNVRALSAGRWLHALLMVTVLAASGCAGSRHAMASASPREGIAVAQGGQIAYTVWPGSTPTATPVVLVHGWSCDQQSWASQVDGLAVPPGLAAHPRLTLDLPGHGRSERGPAEYSMDLFAAAIAAVLEKEHIQRAVLVGHSNGVPVILQFYRRYPERTAALVAVDGPLKPFFTGAPAKLFVSRIREDVDDEFVRGFVRGMMTARLTPSQQDQIMRTMTSTPRDVRAEAFAASVRDDVWTPDPIGVPLLLINAKQPAWDEAYIAFVRTLSPGVEYQEIAGATHFLMMDSPGAVNGLLSDFLARHGL